MSDDGMPERLVDTLDHELQQASQHLDEICRILQIEIKEDESLNGQLERIKNQVQKKETIFEKIKELEEKIDDLGEVE